MLIEKFVNTLLKLKNNVVVKTLITILGLLILIWGLMLNKGADVSFVYNNF